jgi:REP element-mobilizing transposase RayT
MGQYDYKAEYERSLPHFQPEGATLFVNFRLAGSIPKIVMEQLKSEAEEGERALRRTAGPAELDNLIYEERKRQFGRWDKVLDQAKKGPFWLRQSEIAEIVIEALHYRNGKVCDLDVFTVMPNHVHTVFRPLRKSDGGYHPLQTIMHSLKRYTARQANKILGRDGPFWQHENYDHVVREGAEWERIVKYVLNNPVKAGLVENWQDWPYTWLKDM